MGKPKVLVFDIETAPIKAFIWKLFDENVGLNQIHTDWYVLAWSAKWLGQSKIEYQDLSRSRDKSNDKKILKRIWNLLDQADIVITQNGKKFDVKKLNARFIINGFKPTSSFKHIDTYLLAKKHFGFTSNKLEYLADALGVKYKKLTQRKFAGFDLWKECLSNNKEAWNEMKRYNKRDVQATEGIYNKLIAWDSSVNFNLYSNKLGHICSCGCSEIIRNGFFYSPLGKYQRYKCKECWKEVKDRKNLACKKIKVGTTR